VVVVVLESSVEGVVDGGEVSEGWCLMDSCIPCC